MPGEFGTETVRANIEPEKGQLIAGQVVSTGPNQWVALSAADRPIEGVVVKALAANAGTVYITGEGGAAAGFPLAAGETVSIGIDDLSKIAVFVGTTGDGVAYLAITDTGD